MLFAHHVYPSDKVQLGLWYTYIYVRTRRWCVYLYIYKHELCTLYVNGMLGVVISVCMCDGLTGVVYVLCVFYFNFY